MFRSKARLVTFRPPAEARTAIVAIILISSLAFLLFQVRKDVFANLALHQARLAIELAYADAAPETIDIHNNALRPLPIFGDISAWPGQKTTVTPLTLPLPCGAGAACTGATTQGAQDTGGKFVIRHGQLFASIRGRNVTIQTSAPLASLTAGLTGRIATDIAGVLFLGCLLLLVRESRLSDYSVRRLLDASPIPLLLLDSNGHIEFANHAALDLFLADRTRSLRALEENLQRHEKFCAWLIGTQDTDGLIQNAEFEISMSADSIRQLLVSRQSLLVRSRQMIIASVADITVRHEAETALVKAKNAAESLERMKSESLAMISHELRTPVNGVLGLAQLLAGYELPDAASKIVRRMIQAGRTLAVVINDIVDLAMLEVRHIRLERNRFNPQEVIAGAAALASAAAVQKGIGIRVSSLTPLPPSVLGDPARLQQIIINLVSNAIKFTEAGVIELKTDLGARHERSIELVIEVVDTGIGIAPDVLPRLFQPFSQGETGHERRFEGTGLGLAISKGLAEAMGGTISVTSELGHGSTFAVTLPFELADIEESGPKKALALRVLVVDDVALNREIVAELLRAEGCEVTSVESGQEAIDILKVEKFDVVLMDIRMPGMDGLTATTLIRASREPCRHLGPILGLTANPLPTERPLYRLRGIDEIIQKPVDVEQLRSILERTLLRAEVATTALPERISHLQNALGQERTERIVGSFAMVADEDVEAIAQGCARVNLEDVIHHAHRLSGAASNVGFQRLADAASELEQIAQTGSTLGVADAALNVVALYKATERCIHTWFPSASGQGENRYPVP